MYGRTRSGRPTGIFFTQGTFQKSLSRRFDLQANVKYAYDYMNYVNPDTTLMLIDNTFKQQEVYASVASKYAVNRVWDIALSADMQYNVLHSNMDGFVFPRRLTTLVAVGHCARLG